MTGNVQASGNAKQSLLYEVWGEAWNDLRWERKNRFLWMIIKQNDFVRNICLTLPCTRTVIILSWLANNWVERYALRKAPKKYLKSCTALGTFWRNIADYVFCENIDRCLLPVNLFPNRLYPRYSRWSLYQWRTNSHPGELATEPALVLSPKLLSNRTSPHGAMFN